MEKPKPIRFNIALSTDTTLNSQYYTPITKSGASRVTWRVDWDNLFDEYRFLYDKCRVRFNLLCTSATGALPWDSNIGYLCANLPGTYTQNSNGLILGLISPRGSSSNATYDVPSANDIGVDINHRLLMGVQPLTIVMMNSLGGVMANVTSQQYILELLFELY
jgi:hypothetical protein